MTDDTPRTYRWRRREVPKLRVTWIGLVATLLMLIHIEVMKIFLVPVTPRFGLFLLMVVLPVLLLSLWRAGLLPPERVPYEGEEGE